ncbi:MAG: ribokinase [Gaiellales bacterium]
MDEPRWIAVIGSVNADVSVWVPSVPRPGETALGRRAALYPGGKGANQAVQAARLGARVRLVGRIGRDVLGEVVVRSLAGAGVELDALLRDGDAGTGVASIWIDDSGENRIVVAPGANARLSAADVEACRPVLAGAGLVACQLEVPLEALERGCEIAREAGVPVLLNPAPARTLPASLLRAVDWLVPNAVEAQTLCGVEVTGVESGLAAARALRKLGPRGVVVTLGSAGAVVSAPGLEEHVPAVPVDEVVDTTAAGDAFCGALATELARGVGVLDAVRFAVAAGAVAVGAAGAQPSLGDRASVEAALRR